jgi:hypothetical protein
MSTMEYKKYIATIDYSQISQPLKTQNNQPWNHSYKLRGLGINHANQVWSTDITYIKIAGGMV